MNMNSGLRRSSRNGNEFLEVNRGDVRQRRIAVLLQLVASRKLVPQQISYLPVLLAVAPQTIRQKSLFSFRRLPDEPAHAFELDC